MLMASLDCRSSVLMKLLFRTVFVLSNSGENIEYSVSMAIL